MLELSSGGDVIVLGVILLFSPAIVFGLDFIGAATPGDGLTLSIFLGAAGLVLLLLSQKPHILRMLIVVVISVAVLFGQIYGITLFVLS